MSGESEPLPSRVFSFSRLLTFAHSLSLPLALSLTLSVSKYVRSVGLDFGSLSEEDSWAQHKKNKESVSYLPKGIYGAWLLFFVSARTNKRHHHHHLFIGTHLSNLYTAVDTPPFLSRCVTD